MRRSSHRTGSVRLVVTSLLVVALGACGSGSETASGDAGERCTSGLVATATGVQGGASTRAQVDVEVPDCWPDGRSFTMGAGWEVVGVDTSEVLCSAKFSFDEVPNAGSSHRLDFEFTNCAVTAGREVSLRTDAPDFSLAKTTLVAGGEAGTVATTKPTAAPKPLPQRTAVPVAPRFNLVEVRTGEHDDYSRLVFEFTSGPRPDVNVGVSGSELTVQFTENQIGGAMDQEILDTSRIGTPVVGEAGTRWTVPVPAGVVMTHEWLDGPNRLVVDLSGPTFASATAPPDESGARATYNLVEVRTGDEGSRNRVVFEFDGLVPPWDVIDDSGRVIVSFDGDVRGPASTDFKSTVVGSVNREGANSWLIEGVTAVEDTSELTGPARVVIDF